MRRKIGYLLSGLALTMLVAACSNDNQKASTSTPATPMAADDQAQSGQPSQGSIISGKVLETLDASGYTYVHLDEGNKQTWIAIPKSNVAVGDEVKAVFSMLMTNFESKTLGRTFDEVAFCSGLVPADGQQPATAGSETDSSSFSEAVKSSGAEGSGGSSAAMVPATELTVEKAAGENAYTVGELFEKKTDLNGKTVTLRGKVVKVSQNIMGKNWIHLQDGTGNPAEKTHDFVVTADSVPELDKVITVSGVLEADKDFGSGYVYNAIIENAVIKQ